MIWPSWSWRHDLHDFYDTNMWGLNSLLAYKVLISKLVVNTGYYTNANSLNRSISAGYFYEITKTVVYLPNNEHTFYLRLYQQPEYRCIGYIKISILL